MLFAHVKARMGPAGVNLVCVVCLIYNQARSQVFVRVCRELASIDPMWRSRFWIVYANEKFSIKSSGRLLQYKLLSEYSGLQQLSNCDFGQGSSVAYAF